MLYMERASPHRCMEGEVTIPEQNTSVMVQQAEKPIISISGPETLPLAEDLLLHGQSVFGQITIDSMTRQEKEELEQAQLEERVRRL